MSEEEYRYGQFYMHKKTHAVAEVLNTWFGRIHFLSDSNDMRGKLLGDLCDDGKILFDDMPEANMKHWELVGNI